MAGDEDKTTVEVSEEASTEEKKSGGMSKMLMLGGIGLGIIVVGVALALFVVKPMLAPPEGAQTEEVVTDDESGSHAQADADKKAEKHKPKKKKKRSHGSDGEEGGSVVYAIKDIVVNPAGTGGSRFLSISFGFDLATGELVAEFEDREPIIRDALITILSSKTIAQLTDSRQKEIIRLQIKRRVSTLLDTEDLDGVYYTDFVLQ